MEGLLVVAARSTQGSDFFVDLTLMGKPEKKRIKMEKAWQNRGNLQTTF